MTDKEKVDAGEYFKTLRTEEDVPNYITSAFPPEGNYGNVFSKEELNEDMLGVVRGKVRKGKVRENKDIYLENPEKFLFKAELFKEGDIIENSDFQGDNPPHADLLVLRDCPICGENHFHNPVPEVLLGGVSEYQCHCDNSFAPETYYLMLFHQRIQIPNDLVHWARKKLMDGDGYLKNPLIPEEVTLDDMRTNKIAGW